MDKCEKRRGKYGSNHANSLIAKYKNGGDVEIDNCRKCRQGNEISGNHERNERRQSNLPIDSPASYYCSTESYRPRRHHGISSVSRTKYLAPSVPEDSYRADHKNLAILRPFRNHPLFANNVAIVRKNRYKDEPVDEGDFKYGNEDLELTEDDNAEEENREEVAEENCENGSEFNDKDYEEQEADDEVDEESDAIERQVGNLRIQKKNRNEPLPRNHQRINSAEPSQQHRGKKNLISKPPARCRHNVADAIDLPTEEEEDEPEIHGREPLPLRKLGWRPALHHERDTWNHSRNSMERCADLNRSPLGSAQQIRRPRTTRPEVETTMRSGPLEPFHNRKCSRCTTSSGHAPKTTSSRNATCRLQDSRYFIRESNGDEGEDFEDQEPPMNYHTKSRKSKDSRSPIYDPREDARNFDAEIGAIYNSCNSKNLREPPNGHRDRTKHSVRASNRHDSSSATLKHENRYWP